MKVSHEELLGEIIKMEARLSKLERFVNQDHQRLKNLEDTSCGEQTSD